MYIPPKLTTYANEELVELIGPAETQYIPVCDCDTPRFVNVEPEDPILFGRKDDVQLQVDVSGCPNFQSGQVRVIGSDGTVLIDLFLPRFEGNLSGGTWTFVLDLDPSDSVPPPPDTYRVEVVLIESLACRSQPAFGAFEVDN